MERSLPENLARMTNHLHEQIEVLCVAVRACPEDRALQQALALLWSATDAIEERARGLARPSAPHAA
jgi:hypothetical protein